MALFYFSVGATDDIATLKKRLDSIREEGANISYTIVSASSVTLKINEIELSVQYELSQSSNTQYYWYLCDAYNQESLIVLCESPNVNENGKDNTLGIGTYNRAFFRCKNQMIEIPFTEDTFATRFNLIKGKFNTFEDENENDSSIMLTKCTFNDDTVVNNGEIIIADNLYVSSNLQDINFKTIVKDAEGNTFINVGGIFYMDNVDYVTANSTCPILIVVPDGRIKYEWNANTEIVPNGWYDGTRTILARSGRENMLYKENSVIKFSGSTIVSEGLFFDIPKNDNGFILYIIGRSYYPFSYSRYFNFPSFSFLGTLTGVGQHSLMGPVLRHESIFANNGSYLGLEYTVGRSGSQRPPLLTPVGETNSTFWFPNIDISNRPILLYTFKFGKHIDINRKDDIDFSLFINADLVWSGKLAPYPNSTLWTDDQSCTIDSFRICNFQINEWENPAEIKYVGIQPGQSTDEEILDNLQYLTKKFKIGE